MCIWGGINLKKIKGEQVLHLKLFSGILGGSGAQRPVGENPLLRG